MLNVKQARGSKLWQRLNELREKTPPPKREYQEFIAKCGLDPLLQQIDSLFLAFARKRAESREYALPDARPLRTGSDPACAKRVAIRLWKVSDRGRVRRNWHLSEKEPGTRFGRAGASGRSLSPDPAGSSESSICTPARCLSTRARATIRSSPRCSVVLALGMPFSGQVGPLPRCRNACAAGHRSVLRVLAKQLWLHRYRKGCRSPCRPRLRQRAGRRQHQSSRKTSSLYLHWKQDARVQLFGPSSYLDTIRFYNGQEHRGF